ncbi:MAG: thiamine ABC transporter substrate-binding protein [Spirochaetaceae bacterium]|nr:thiamine ABC transporter substrate-binding protein [Spirochaetaceae bacterium]
MKKHILFIVMLTALTTTLLFAQGTKEESSNLQSQQIEDNTLTVYAYDSFCGEWGPGQKVVENFEKKTGIKVDLVSAGDGPQMLNKVELEKDSPVADVVLGIPNDLAAKALNSSLFESYSAPALKDIPAHLIFDKTNTLNPFDYGDFAFCYDSEKLAKKDVPTSLEDLTDPKYKGKIILIDPRTSTVGLGLLLWTREVFGDDYLTWWEGVKDNALTITDGWSSAYGMFTEGEAPIVLSYTTSPAYHVMWENTTRYRAAIFNEGHSLTIEGISLVKSSRHKANAKKFIDFVLDDAQADIAVTNTMYPTNSKAPLPDAYKWAPIPEKQLSIDYKDIEKNLDTWLADWTTVMSK